MRPEVNMTALGAHLASARRQQQLRQADLAREVGIHAVTLSRIENGKLPGVTVAVLARLAMRLDLSLDHLLQWQPGQRLHLRGGPPHRDNDGAISPVQEDALEGLRAS
jgi:transcriptional regulator with XRE-family HTH domain